MSLNVSTAYYRMKGIDVNNVSNVANQILNSDNKSNAEANIQALDLSKFNRSTLGIDLYSSRTNVDLQKQIAMTQAGLYAQAVNVQQLNSNAAINLYGAAAVQKSVELTQSTSFTELTAPKSIEKQENIIELFDISDKHQNASNRYNPFRQGSEFEEEKSNGEL